MSKTEILGIVSSVLMLLFGITNALSMEISSRILFIGFIITLSIYLFKTRNWQLALVTFFSIIILTTFAIYFVSIY
jgi:hypothetical protein